MVLVISEKIYKYFCKFTGRPYDEKQRYLENWKNYGMIRAVEVGMLAGAAAMGVPAWIACRMLRKYTLSFSRLDAHRDVTVPTVMMAALCGATLKGNAVLGAYYRSPEFDYMHNLTQRAKKEAARLAESQATTSP
eukprot:gnl/Hemi2/28589_TR9474_c0_g1_i1.p1 gnl/Hemi2/28589_TR9474_c0_g1~~gnl/Hemi2/28589_TR9474_c0_g1_i1.p1  ORF type:complete len:135 (-),score=39.80 gnl/Hemi2/28589_TR9474_c0_g1_i1:167-571(-)